MPDRHGVNAPVEPGYAAIDAGPFPLFMFLSRAVHAGRDDTEVYHEAPLLVKRWLPMAVVYDSVTGVAVV